MDAMHMRQGSLFDISARDVDEPVGLSGMLPSIRAEMHRVAAAYKPGRKLLVDAINEVARREAVALTSGGAKSIDIEVLNKWLQPQEKGHAPNLDAVTCFCLATGDASPLRPLLKMLGLTAVSAAELDYLEMGRLVTIEQETRERKSRLRAKLRARL